MRSLYCTGDGGASYDPWSPYHDDGDGCSWPDEQGGRALAVTTGGDCLTLRSATKDPDGPRDDIGAAY